MWERARGGAKKRLIGRKVGKRERTRSSPTGPAEQEEGGSLQRDDMLAFLSAAIIEGSDQNAVFEGRQVRRALTMLGNKTPLSPSRPT
jgi:hypothetical protein